MEVFRKISIVNSLYFFVWPVVSPCQAISDFFKNKIVRAKPVITHILMGCKTFKFQPIFTKLEAMLVHINVKKSIWLHKDSLKNISTTCLQTWHLATIRYFGLSRNPSMSGSIFDKSVQIDEKNVFCRIYQSIPLGLKRADLKSLWNKFLPRDSKISASPCFEKKHDTSHIVFFKWCGDVIWWCDVGWWSGEKFLRMKNSSL